MAELNVTELDFDTIKNNLRTYLAAQPEFTDYDFTGSALMCYHITHITMQFLPIYKPMKCSLTLPLKEHLWFLWQKC